MNSEQKQAWLAVIMGIISLICFLVALPFVGPMIATAAFGLFGLAGLGPLIFRKTPTDERDRSIAKRANLAGATTSYGVFLLGNMSVWFVAKRNHQEQVNIDLLMLVVFLGIFALFFVRSVVLLVLYARHSGNEEA